MKKNNKRRFSFCYFLLWLIFTLSLALSQAAVWAYSTFHVELAEMMFTIRAPLAGAGGDFVSSALRYCLPKVLAGALGFGLLLLFFQRWNRLSFRLVLRIRSKVLRISSRALERLTAAIISLGMLAMTCFYLQSTYNVIGYVKTNLSTTTIYDDYYVMPSDVDITAGEKRNLLCIYLESMEITYADEAHGGANTQNYIPYLTDLALNNTSFGSSATVLGGIQNLPNTAWTSAALIASTSGIPFNFPMNDNDLTFYSSFAENLQTMGQILDENGYYQEFLCGSDATFGGRRQYFTQHGNYQIYDYDTAMEKGAIPPGYKVWWGFEDENLFDIAKSELTRISQQDQPFNLTMLTVDTHVSHGYICQHCDLEKYNGEVLPTVLDCTERLLEDFLNWCKEQPFYENTTIVLLGDHPRMDTDLVNGATNTSRKVYNCFLNPAKAPSTSTEGRSLTQLDMFPTILSSLGFEIPGNRLGMGTDLFSDAPTLLEELGYDYLSTELQKQSKFYKENFY